MRWLGHLWALLALRCALVLATLYAVHVSLGFLITCFGRRLGFTEASDIAPLALLLLLLPARERLPAMGGGRAAGLR